MKTTMELLEKAKASRPDLSERQLSIQLGYSDMAIQMAKKRGSLSPVVAGQLAELVGENVEHWIAVAAIEAQPRSRVTDHLRKVLHAIA